MRRQKKNFCFGKSEEVNGHRPLFRSNKQWNPTLAHRNRRIGGKTANAFTVGTHTLRVISRHGVHDNKYNMTALPLPLFRVE